MKLPGSMGHLTYCMNIRPTQTFADVQGALTGPVAAVKKRRSARMPHLPWACGFPAMRWRSLTIRQGARGKQDVYQPDWRSKKRVRYTNRLADLMAEIAAPGEMVSLSTVSGTIKPLARGAMEKMTENYLRCVAHMVGLRRTSGVTVALAIEPEPYCIFETIPETDAQ